MIKKALTHSIPFAALVIFSGCKGTVAVPGGAGTPKWVPSDGTSFSGSSATPPHHLPPSEYPFDAAGNYLPQMARASQGSSGGSASSSRSRGSSSSSSPPSSRKSSGGKTHKITSGDTLWGISKKYGVSVAAIKKANGMSSDKVVSGRTIRIP
jgi:nucleoid-associated protein YgaU